MIKGCDRCYVYCMLYLLSGLSSLTLLLSFPHRKLFMVWDVYSTGGPRHNIPRCIQLVWMCPLCCLFRLVYFTFLILNCLLLLNCLDYVFCSLIWLCTCHYSLLLCTSGVICIWCLARSLDLTHLWCLGPDYDPAGDAIIEAPVVGDCEWGPVDQVVEPKDREPTLEGWGQLFLGFWEFIFVVRWVG